MQVIINSKTVCNLMIKIYKIIYKCIASKSFYKFIAGKLINYNIII